MTHHELYKQIGIDPPRGVLLYGPPGTGKTMLAKAVANHTTAAFIRVVGSEFVQKYLGEVCFQCSPTILRDMYEYLCNYCLICSLLTFLNLSCSVLFSLMLSNLCLVKLF